MQVGVLHALLAMLVSQGLCLTVVQQEARDKLLPGHCVI